MALKPTAKLRSLLGEDIPKGGSDEDTMFADAEIQDYLDGNPNIERAAYEGWRVKLARLSNLVDTTEGNAQKKYSQLRDAALEQVKLYSKSSGGPTEGRTRVGQIKRPAVEW
jgi:hypothetical protein